jgi:hypothetical protein
LLTGEAGCDWSEVMGMRGTIADLLKTGSPIHFRQSAPHLLATFMATMLVTVAFASMGYEWMPNPFFEERRWQFRFMSAMFLPISLFALYLSVNAGKKGLVLSRSGIADHRIRSKEIPWSQVDAVLEGEARLARFIVLRLSDAGDAPQSLVQRLNSSVLGLDSNERMISSTGLEVGHSVLVEAIVGAWRAGRQLHAAHR